VKPLDTHQGLHADLLDLRSIRLVLVVKSLDAGPVLGLVELMKKNPAIVLRLSGAGAILHLAAISKRELGGMDVELSTRGLRCRRYRT